MISLDGYADLERIGQGGLGDVYRARRISTGGTVAIKMLRDVSDQSVTWHRTRRELTALVSLAGHAHVIQLLELIDQPGDPLAVIGAPALVMEYAPGGSVAELMRVRPDGLSPAEIVLVGRHTASALTAAHAQGIVHRDVKPQNLLIDVYGQVKLCDFGVAALTRSEEFQVHTNALSMRYASPEDLDEESDVGTSSDVYSLGATLLHLVHGAPPSLKDRLSPWVRPPGSDDGAAGELDAVIEACLDPNPTMRPTAGEVLERLEYVDRALPDRVRGLTVEFDPPTPMVTPAATAVGWPDLGDATDATLHRAGRVPRAASAPPVASGRRPARWAALFLVAVAVGSAAIGWWWWGMRDARRDAAERPVATSTPGTSTPGTSTPGTSTPGTSAAPGSTGSVAASEPSAPAVVDRPDGLSPIADLTWPFGDPGECLVQVVDVDELRPVDCAEPHDLQRYAVATLPVEAFGDEATFDQAAVRAAAAAGCDDAFEPFAGVPVVDGAFDRPFTAPSAETWAQGDRRFQCFVGVDGARLVGDATGIAG